jgi:hypothetical protein
MPLIQEGFKTGKAAFGGLSLIINVGSMIYLEIKTLWVSDESACSSLIK